jgi:hypothetical protein
MHTGKYFRLNAPALGIETIGVRQETVQIPAGEIVTVLSGPRSDDSKMLDVLWHNRTLVMFVEDIQARGQEIGQRPQEGTTRSVS